MPTVKLPSFVSSLSGKMGDVVYRTSKSGKTYVSKAPKKSTKPPSAAQLAQQERFKLAQAYAAAAREEPVYARLAVKRRRSAHQLAVSDWLKPPVIHGVERRAGQRVVGHVCEVTNPSCHTGHFTTPDRRCCSDCP